MSAKEDKWYDSGCVRHMNIDKSIFSCITSKDCGYITYGNNGKGKLIREGDIAMHSSKIYNVYLLMDSSIIY